MSDEIRGPRDVTRLMAKHADIDGAATPAAPSGPSHEQADRSADIPLPPEPEPEYGVPDDRGANVGTEPVAPVKESGKQGQDAADDEGKTDKRTPAASTVLVNLALSRYCLGVTADGDVFAVAKNGSHVARMLRGGKLGLRSELAAAYFKAYARAAPQQALADALLILEGNAHAAEPTSVHLRVAEHDGAAYVDLGDRAGRVVRIDGDGWAVLDSGVPVLFSRTQLTGALPTPARHGELAALWQVVNVAEPDRPLVLAWLVHTLISADTPHPILSLFAEQGTGKSSATRTLVSVVDPSPVPLRKPPKDADGWVTAAAGSWAVAIDNLSTLPAWLSDSMCRAVTGDGDVRRALYTDGDLAVFAFRRCLIVNGIDIGAMRGDYAERSLVATLERITPDKRRTENELATYWTAQHPRVFGALLDLAARVMHVLPSVRLDKSPRMADFARTLAAVDIALETAGLPRYLDQARTLAVDSLDSEPFIAELRQRLAAEFTGSAGELLAAVQPGDEHWRAPAGWPKDGRAVSGILRRTAPALRQDGWTVEDQGNANKRHTTMWRITPPGNPQELGRDEPSPSSPSSLSQVHGPFSGEQRGEDGARTSSPSVPGEDGEQPARNTDPAYSPKNMPLTSADEQASKASTNSLLSRPGEPLCRVCQGRLGAVAAAGGIHADCAGKLGLNGAGSAA